MTQDLEALREYAASYRAIEERGDLLGTALENNREDQAFGAAWRRAEAALPEGQGTLTFFRPFRYANGDEVSDWTVRFEVQVQWGGRGKSRYSREFADGPTPTAALLQLAEKLEGMK